MSNPDFNQEDLFSVYQLAKDYPTPAGELSVLKDICFRLPQGEVAFIIGRSGSGKSTFLNLLGGLDRPTKGKILFEGEDMTLMSEKALARVRNRRIGFVFQFFHLLPELTVYENVLLPTLIARNPQEKWAKECLKKVRLYSRCDYYPTELSGGEKQRVAIARALANRPSVVLCDEPTGNLDEETAASVFSLMEDLHRKEGQSFVIVTHDESIAARYRLVYRLVDGILLPQNQPSAEVRKFS